MHSNSSLNCFANCQMRYKLSYIDKIPPESQSPHLGFGIMAHDTLYKAGRLRDDVADRVVNDDDYYSVIPSETLYPEYKDYFHIGNWHNYFVGVIKQLAIYEQNAIQDIINTSGEPRVIVEREIAAQTGNFKGIIDLLIRTDSYAYIYDYKFSDNRKSQADFEENSQLQLYAYFVHTVYDIPLHNIKIGYIDIPKKMPDKPILLSTGKLSRSKSQNCTAETYKLYVEALHGKDDPVYNCEKGGYYYDCYMELQNNKTAYLTDRWLDLEVYAQILQDLMDAAEEIDAKRANPNAKWLRKYDSYSCKNCDYKKHCKPWLTEVW